MFSISCNFHGLADDETCWASQKHSNGFALFLIQKQRRDMSVGDHMASISHHKTCAG